MKNKIILLAISILYAILFYNNNLGLNVIIFTTILLLHLYYFFKNNKLIKNKFGLLFMIPIFILSLTFLIYDNYFKILNILIIPLLYLFMYMFTIKPVYNITVILDDLLSLAFEPLSYIGSFSKDTVSSLEKSTKITEKDKKLVKSFITIIPVIIVVLYLLLSADEMFLDLFKKFTIVFEDFDIKTVIITILMASIMFIYLGSTLKYLKEKYKTLYKTEPNKIKIEDMTVKMLLTVLNVIYVIFDYIQINSLLLKNVSENINYANYAREGFLQLTIISVINISVILLSKRCKENNYIKISSIIMSFLTLIIIFSSLGRMYLYECAYGYTFLRLLVYVALITEIILLIPTIIYILNNKENNYIFKRYAIIIMSVYSLINLFSPDKIIANKNIERYYNDKKLDIIYLMNDNYDNINILMDLYEKTDDEIIKKNLKHYFEFTKKELNDDNIFEFNFSKNEAKKILRDFN